MSKGKSKTQEILDKLQGFKDDLVKEFESIGLGRDALLRVHNAIDEASAVVASRGPVEGHDLNVDLAENPEDHPARQGQETTPINTDDNVNNASMVDAEPDAVSPDKGRRVGAKDKPHAPKAG